MMRRMTAGLAFLLVAGASQAVLAQEHDRKSHESAPPSQGQHGPGPGAPQPSHGPGGPPGGSHAYGGGPQNSRNEGGPGPGPQHYGSQGQGYQGRGGSEYGGRGKEEAGPQRFEHGAEHVEHGPDRSARGPDHLAHGPSSGPGGSRRFDHEEAGRGARAPGVEHGIESRHEARVGGPAVHAGNGPSPWGGRPGAPAHWQAGRAPPVFWAHERYHAGLYQQPYGFYARAWSFGEFLPHGWYARNYWIGNFIAYGLPYPPPGFEWVRVGGDAILVDEFTGRIVQVVRGIFW